MFLNQLAGNLSVSCHKVNSRIFNSAQNFSTCNINMSVPKPIKIAVWNRYCDPEKINGECYTCGGIIQNWSFEAGHVVPKSKGGSDSVDNLRPVCGLCNKSMGTHNMLEWVHKRNMSDVKASNKRARKNKKQSGDVPDIVVTDANNNVTRVVGDCGHPQIIKRVCELTAMHRCGVVCKFRNRLVKFCEKPSDSCATIEYRGQPLRLYLCSEHNGPNNADLDRTVAALCKCE